MALCLFIDLVEQYFHYLIDDYGFSVVAERYSPKYMGNAQVVYESSSVGISIVLDRGEVLINLGPRSRPRHDWFEFTDVVHYFAPNLEPVYVFPQDQFPHEVMDPRVIQDFQVSRLAQIMHQHCEPILRGDLSMQTRIQELEGNRAAEMLEEFSRLSQEYRKKHPRS